MTHSLERTSPMGGPFLGRCRYCGKADLPSRAALDYCESAPAQDQQVLDALEGPPVRASGEPQKRPDFDPNFAQCPECGGTFGHYAPCWYSASASPSDDGAAHGE